MSHLTQADAQLGELLARLRALTGAIASAAPLALPDQSHPAAEVDLHVALTAVTDRLLERVAAFTAPLQESARPLDAVETLTARLLLADLALLAGAWQALRALAARRLDAAEADLQQAGRVLTRALRKLPD